MQNYIDGFVLPIPRVHLNEYKKVAEKVAEIWKEYGAIEYVECFGEDLKLEGTRSFTELVNQKKTRLSCLGGLFFHLRKFVIKQTKMFTLMQE